MQIKLILKHTCFRMAWATWLWRLCSSSFKLVRSLLGARGEAEEYGQVHTPSALPHLYLQLHVEEAMLHSGVFCGSPGWLAAAALSERGGVAFRVRVTLSIACQAAQTPDSSRFITALFRQHTHTPVL